MSAIICLLLAVLLVEGGGVEVSRKKDDASDSIVCFET